MDSARLNSIARQTSISHTDLIYLFHHRDEFYLYFDATLEESEYFDSYFETSNFKRFMEAYSKGERFIPDQPNIDVLRVLHERQFDKAAEECLRQLKFLCSKTTLSWVKS